MNLLHRSLFFLGIISTIAMISTVLKPQSATAKQICDPNISLEINGCQQNSSFGLPVDTKNPNPIKLTQMMPVSPRQTASTTTISGYPLDNFTTIALPYGWQIHPITRKVFFHSGIDLVAEVGTPVKAIAPGIVVFAKDQESYGKLVIINHAGGLQTRYAQLETIQVNLGQTVQKDEVLGTVGATGQPTSRETHLHFEIRADEPLGWTAKDPKGYLK
ncbi:MAG: M23 family metallopeptidase [Nostocales cyanobacterium]|nr:MAG: M23 family metallopeptidase [Nostocales cyanobacterium]TAF15139.1 MAG: M23 family metallopeptidase [Nostocales cyanobacterium]